MAIIQGDLAEYALPDLLQFMHTTRKVGQLVLESDHAAPAGVFFAGGEVVHAYCPPRKGVPALYQVLGWDQGRFAFLKNVAPAERTIFVDLQNLLLDGLRRLDEYRLIARRLPPRDAILHLAPEEAGEARPEIRLTRDEWQVLAQVNGRRTLDEVLHLAGRPEDEGARVTYGLLLAGLVTTARDDGYLAEIVPERVPAELTPTRAPPPTLLANLVIHGVDGRRSLRTLLAELGCTEGALADELRLLVRTGWIRFRQGAALYQRYLAG